MSNTSLPHLPTTGRLLRATALSFLVAGILLVTIVLPAEYGVDPTGIGRMLGLDALTSTAVETEVTPIDAEVREPGLDRNADAASNAAAAFGASANQSFATESVSPATGQSARMR